MTRVFLSGSRVLSRLDDHARQRLDNMIENALDIVVGDASGADKAMQTYLADRHYRRVTVFYVGQKPRNNVGSWEARAVTAEGIVAGRDFYATKDKAMVAVADVGFVLWDGKSIGSVQNMARLVHAGKKLVVYCAPDREFKVIGDERELFDLLEERGQEFLTEIERKIELPSSLADRLLRQRSLGL